MKIKLCKDCKFYSQDTLVETKADNRLCKHPDLQIDDDEIFVSGKARVLCITARKGQLCGFGGHLFEARSKAIIDPDTVDKAFPDYKIS